MVKAEINVPSQCTGEPGRGSSTPCVALELGKMFCTGMRCNESLLGDHYCPGCKQTVFVNEIKDDNSEIES